MAVRVVPDFLFDDGYVTLRYAANLARGWGFVFNRGERVCGTTTPLFTLLLAGLGRIFGVQHLETIAVTLGVLASVGALYLTARALQEAKIPLPLTWVYLLALMILPAFLSVGVSGMETPLVLFLMAASLLFFLRGRWGTVAFLCGLLLLTRIDTVIWTSVLGLHLLLEKKMWNGRELITDLGVFLATIAPWYVFSAIYFGTIIPQSVIGKAVSHGSFRGLDRPYILAFLNSYIPGVQSPRYGWIAAALTLILVCLGMVHLWRKFPPLRPLATFCVLYSAAFFLGRAPLFEWYFAPVKWAYYFVLLCGVQAIARALATGPLRPARPWAWALLAILVLAYGGRYLRHWFGTGPENPWSDISALIEKSTAPDAHIFLEHIGLVGYKTDRYIYDSMGLVTPRTVALKRIYGDGWLPKAVAEFDAGVVVFYDQDVETMRRSRDPEAGWFWQTYARVTQIHTPEVNVNVYAPGDHAAAFSPHSAARP